MKTELIGILDAFVEEYDKYDLRDLDGKEPFFAEKGYSVITEEVHGGNEGAGEEHWIVLRVTTIADSNVSYWEIPGWYQSYDGSYLEISNLFEVEPQEKVITVWEQKK